MRRTRRYVELQPGLPETPLLGGDVSEGVVRVGDTVRRPLGPNAAVIHEVLEHLERVGFDGAPRLLGVDDQGREVLTFIEGEVAGRPRPPWVADEDRLRSVARLLRDFHRAMEGFVLPADLVPDWGIPDLPDLPDLVPPEPDEVIGHQDITPENVVFHNGRAIALIDFDLLKPASRVLEVVNALVWWAPLADPVDRYPEMRHFDAARRARIFVDEYGLDQAGRRRLVPVAVGTARRSWRLMQHRAETYGGGWRRMWDEGVGDTITRRRAWLESNAAAITRALTSPRPDQPPEPGQAGQIG
jgi:hypothetical protein